MVDAALAELLGDGEDELGLVDVAALEEQVRIARRALVEEAEGDRPLQRENVQVGEVGDAHGSRSAYNASPAGCTQRKPRYGLRVLVSRKLRDAPRIQAAATPKLPPRTTRNAPTLVPLGLTSLEGA